MEIQQNNWTPWAQTCKVTFIKEIRQCTHITYVQKHWQLGEQEEIWVRPSRDDGGSYCLKLLKGWGVILAEFPTGLYPSGWSLNVRRPKGLGNFPHLLPIPRSKNKLYIYYLHPTWFGFQFVYLISGHLHSSCKMAFDIRSRELKIFLPKLFSLGRHLWFHILPHILYPIQQSVWNVQAPKYIMNQFS